MGNIFEDLKSKVSIEDVASTLGYNVNPRAGTRGNYLEMQLFADGEKQDTIVIRKGRNGSTDSYFHRGSGHGGSVIDFVKENLSQLGYHGDGGWKAVFDAFSKFTNLPPEEFHHDATVREWQQTKAIEGFDPKRFIVDPLSANPDAARMIYTQRGLTDDTIRTFEPWIRLLRDTKSSYQYPCLAFPYREPGRDEVVGYELRGNGTFKGKAAGTNSTTAAWIVDMTPYGNPLDARKVFFAESAYDIMALYQRQHLFFPTEEAVFVSTGGQLSPRQISGIMGYYSRAVAVDCFDNDLSGRLYGIRTAAIASGIRLDVVRCDDCVRFNANGKVFSLPLSEVNTMEFRRHVPAACRISLDFLPPKGYKDWNDVVMGFPMSDAVTPSKYQLYDNLRLKRSNGPKR